MNVNEQQNSKVKGKKSEKTLERKEGVKVFMGLQSSHEHENSFSWFIIVGGCVVE